MSAAFTKIVRMHDLDAALDRPADEAVILFNHDPWCPISARAMAEVERVEGDIMLVDVSREREITRAIAERTGIRHESPQVIVLRGGTPVWSASHYRITAEAVQSAVTAAPTT
jgi:bacillithiol system protein YtxJ